MRIATTPQDYTSKPSITGKQVAIVCATMDRQKNVERLLESISCLSKPGQILIADGGKSTREVVSKFKNKLPVEWIPARCQVRFYNAIMLGTNLRRCRNNSTRRRRQHSSSRLDGENAVFWNENANKPDKKPLAGVGFNIIDALKTT